MTDERRALGREGEAAAARYLERSGHRVLERNFRGRSGEIDLITSDRGTIVFVEVRLRRGTGYGTPEESVVPAKQGRIARAAEEYVARRRLDGRAVRFDVVAVGWRDGRLEIEHIEAAFEA